MRAASITASAPRRAAGLLRAPAAPTLREPLARRLGRAPIWVADPRDALGRCVGPDSTVFVHSAAATPTRLLEALVDVAVARQLRGVTTLHIHLGGPDAPHLSAAARPHIRDVSLFLGGAAARDAVAAGAADAVSINLSDIPALFKRGGRRIDVALVNVSPPDAHGYCSLGPSVDVTRSALQAAGAVVAQVNARVPRVFGDGSIHVSQLDFAWSHDAPMHDAPGRARSAAEEAIGRLVAEHLIDDGATLQLGIGGVADTVLAQLAQHAGLGVHSEMISDGIVALHAAGVITGAHKATEPGRVTASFAAGTAALYDFLHDNVGVVMRDAGFTNDTAVIRRQPKMTAVNSALEVDLTGQVCADSLGTTLFSGIGGQGDFTRGAALCADGRAIIALPSTTHRGESRIVALLKPGAGVTVGRSHVHYVVTEHGIAELFGKSMRERAQALITVAHPSHRDALAVAARARALFV